MTTENIITAGALISVAWLLICVAWCLGRSQGRSQGRAAGYDSGWLDHYFYKTKEDKNRRDSRGRFKRKEQA